MAAEHQSKDELTLLREKLRGKVLVPGDSGWQEAIQNWNGDHSFKPMYAAVVEGPADVACVLEFCKRTATAFSVMGGGHSLSSKCLCDGMVLSLKRLRTVLVDPAEKTVWVGGGATWGDVDKECQPFGLHSPGGAVSHTGVAGLTLGGGYDPALSRSIGLSADNLLEVQIVLANGEITRASKKENPDLFWALRGAGAAFGVVTAFKFKLSPVPKICYGGPLIFDPSLARDLLRFTRDQMLTKVPNELTIYAGFFNPPPAKAMVLAICFWYVGDPANDFEGAKKFIDQYRAKGPLVDHCGPVPFPVMHCFLDAMFYHGIKVYGKSVGIQFADFSDQVIDGLIERAKTKNPESFLMVEHWGGKSTSFSDGAYASADSGLTIFGMGSWLDNAERDDSVKWSRDVAAFVRMHAKHPTQTYINFNDGEAGSAFFDHARLDKLRKLKKQYDPDNMFTAIHF